MAGAFLRRTFHFLFGRPLRSDEDKLERFSIATGLPVVGADLIASSAYATEAMLRVLVIGGVGALSLSMPLGIGVAALLVLVGISYQQTLSEYPTGGGSYIVAGENLGKLAALTAGAALMIDYVLDVAVSIAAGIDAISSMLPEIHTHRIAIAVAWVALLTWGNLRGIRTAGVVFSAPVYLYLLSILIVIAIGVAHWFSGTLPKFDPGAPPLNGASDAFQSLGLFAVLRAFASGAVALTGIEATANAVPAFRPPEVRNARATQALMVALFALLFLGLTFLAQNMQVVPDHREIETLTSRVTRTLLGRNGLYYVVQAATAMLLGLAANTAFTDFPRVASLMAKDKFLPPQFAFRGERLAFTHGIVLLALFASAILVAFRSSVHALIPLFTVGVFIAFTLSQAGMVVHWWRHRKRGWRWSMAVNALGASACAVVMVIVAATKFTHGAWAVLVLTPLLVLVFYLIHRYLVHVDVAVKVLCPGDVTAVLAIPPGCEHYLLIPVANLDRISLSVVRYVNLIAPPDSRSEHVHVQAIHVTTDRVAAEDLKRRWDEAVPGIPLIVLESPFRTLLKPMLRYIDELTGAARDCPLAVTVFVPEVLTAHGWQRILHKNLTLLLKGSLLFRSGRTAFVSVPVTVE